MPHYSVLESQLLSDFFFLRQKSHVRGGAGELKPCIVLNLFSLSLRDETLDKDKRKETPRIRIFLKNTFSVMELCREMSLQ